MPALLIGDPHFAENNIEETNQMTEDCVKIAQKIKKDKGLDFIVVMGDTFDEGEHPYSGCIYRVTKFLIALRDVAHVYVLVGNHDRKNNKVYLTEDHCLAPFKYVPGMTIVDRCHTMEWNGKKVCMMPYVENGRFHEACKDCDIRIKDYDLFFSHQEFKGCKINKLNGEDCDYWKPAYPLNIGGHIHDKEIVSDNLIYIGTGYQQSYGESTDKGIYILYENFELECVPLRIPKKIHLKITYKEIETVELEEGVKYKVTISGIAEDCRLLMASNRMKKKFKGVKILYKDTRKRKAKAVVVSQSFDKRYKDLRQDDEIVNRIHKEYRKE